MKYNITKEYLEQCLKKRMTNKEIADEIGCGKSNVNHFIT